MSTNRISVVIPAYRAAQTIRRAVDSALGQTRPPGEVIVVDDGSPDDVAGAVASYGDRITYVRKPNGGAASARNLGIDRSRGDVVAFLDADDYWEPQKLARQADILERHPEVGLVAGRYYAQDPRTGARELQATAARPEMFDRILRPTGREAFDVATMIWTTALIVRRQVLGDQRFESGLEPAEDRDLWSRLVRGSGVYLFSDPLATAVLEAGSISRTNIDRDCSNMLRVIHRHADLLGRKGTRHWEARTYRRWAAEHLASGAPSLAARYAVSRLRRDPASIEGWWILAKSLARTGMLKLRRPGSPAQAG